MKRTACCYRIKNKFFRFDFWMSLAVALKTVEWIIFEIGICCRSNESTLPLLEMNRYCINAHIRSISCCLSQQLIHLTSPWRTQLFQHTVWHPAGKWVFLQRPGTSWLQAWSERTRLWGRVEGDGAHGSAWRSWCLDWTRGWREAAKAPWHRGVTLGVGLFLLHHIKTWDPSTG